ncbi:MAG TPA: ribulokinase [Vicinamibacterales bacterium]|nr:ribulokinase [Vicinamibacterales bacterium]
MTTTRRDMFRRLASRPPQDTPKPQPKPGSGPRGTYAIGIDFGTNSARAIVVSCADGSAVGTGVSGYHSGDHGVLTHGSDPHLARQNPADYIGSLGHAITAALGEAEKAVPGFSRDQVIGIGVDTTGSTPLPLDAKARPLSIDPHWEGNLAAQAWLWKDHTAAEEAAAITAIAREHAPEYLAPIGGTYSSEWWWSKIWKCLKVAPDVFDAAASWVELADFVPAVLAGVTDPKDIVRSVCAAGHKAMYSDEWGGLPSKAFLARLDPKLAELRDRLYDRAFAPGMPAGNLSAEWARALGLPQGIVIAMGGFDAHYGAVGSGIEEGTLVKIIGTSTCDCAIVKVDKPSAYAQGASVNKEGLSPQVPGICGIVNGSIMPGFYGIEAGQSAVGDILNWVTEISRAADLSTVAPGAKVDGKESSDARHERLTREAGTLRAGQSGLLALDWHNGNRTILVDPKLTGLLVGMTLHTTPAEIYRAMIEATAFGARVIIDRMREHGVPVERVVCCGGIAEKNDVFMQIYADVIGQPMLIAGSPQAPALGAAISAAVTAGHFDSWSAAQKAMTSVKEKRFTPDPAAHAVYNQLYAIYRDLHDEFGGVKNVDLGSVMKKLLEIRK